VLRLDAGDNSSGSATADAAQPDARRRAPHMRFDAAGGESSAGGASVNLPQQPIERRG